MLRVSEIYPSFQGEGPNTGKPTLFVRFAGCNLRCPGWPCDTPYAIDPKVFRKEQKLYTATDLLSRIAALYPHITNVCLTGGEPFLQNKEDLHTLVHVLRQRYVNTEVFTNGTLDWGQHMTTVVGNFIMDWKLPGSGEFPDEEVVLRNFSSLCRDDAVKFTVKDVEDLERAYLIWQTYIVPKDDAPVVFCGRIWDGSLTEKDIAEWVLNQKLPWRLNVQVHKYVWDPNQRAI